MFDRLALDLEDSSTSLVERRILSNAKQDIDWLRRARLLTTVAGLVATGQPRGAEVPVDGEDFLAPVSGGRANLMGRVGGLLHVATQGLRYTAAELRQTYGIDAVAVPTGIEVQNADATAGREAVVRLVLNEFPMPSEANPWEKIQSFRSDSKARGQFSRLKQWINGIGKAGLREYEVSDKLHELLFEYEESMNLNRLKTERGKLEVIITTTAEIADSLVRLKLSAAAQAVFAVKEHKMKLLEEEKKVLGREIAYVVTVRDTFGGA
jgi:hypothetical protein